jgi:hypothetical protein
MDTAEMTEKLNKARSAIDNTLEEVTRYTDETDPRGWSPGAKATQVTKIKSLVSDVDVNIADWKG